MNARVAAQRYDFTGLPSGYCMFELFEAGDTVDEITEDALKWKKEADRLPEKFAEQTNRIWENWKRAREELRKAAGAEDKVQRCLDFIEYEQGREIDFEGYM